MAEERTEDFKTEIAELRQRSVQEVAEALGLTFNGNEWTEHDSFKLDLKKNRASWYSRGEDYKNMDVFQLVMRMRDVSFQEAYQFVKTGEFTEVEIKINPKKPFVYYLEKFEDESFSEARAYLKNERQLSDETIDFFIAQGVLAQATRRTNTEMSTALSGKYYYDPVIVFKTLDRYNKVIGTSMIGIDDNQSIYELEDKAIKRKQIAYNSDGLGGVNISIGTPKRIVVVEAPIDLMSYYELHKSDLRDVMLVALDGSSTKLSSVKRYVMDILTDKEWSLNPDRSKLNEQFKMTLENTDVLKQQPNLITVAVDNDEAGLRMIKDFQKQNIPVVADLPPLRDGQTKNDWNDELKHIKGGKVVTATQIDKVHSITEAQKTNEPTWGDIYNRVPDWVQTAYEKIEEGYDYPAKTFPADWDMFGDDFDLNANSILTDEQKVLIQTTRAFYDDDGKFHSFKEALEISGASIPENMPAAYDDRPTLEEEAKWLLAQERAEEAQWLLSSQEETQQEIQKQRENEEKQMTEKSGQESLFENLAAVTPELEDLNNKKAPDRGQEPNVRGEHSRNSDSLRGEPLRSASQPDEQGAHPDFPANVQLHFSIDDSNKSIYKQGYHPITKSEMNRLNRFALSIQQTAKWYLNNVASSDINYLYKEGDDIKVMKTEFRRDNFSHLIGLAPIVNGVENPPSQTLLDLAEGKGKFDNLMVSNAIKDKMMVMPLFPDIVESKSFIFDDLSNIEKFHKIDLSKAIKTEDEDLLLAFRDVDGVGFPASIMRIKGALKTSLQSSVEDKTILGVFRERNGVIETLSVNDDLIHDKGEELKTILENDQAEILTSQQATLMNFDLQAVEFSDIYKDNEKVPQAQDLTLALEDSESFEWGDDSRLFVRAELLDFNTGETVIHTPFIVDKPTETDFVTWWQDNYKVIDKQIRSSDDVVALEKELDFRKLPKLEQEKILDDQNGVLSLFDDENNSNKVEQTVAEENIQTDKTEGESYRLTQARQKLERLENEFSAAVQDVFDHQKTTNGQPMNDKRTSGAFFKKQNQKEDKAGDLQAEIKKQRERIEALEWREENAKLGLNASGGLVKSVENIELWQQRIERLEFVRDYNKSHGLPLGTPFDNGTRLEFYDSKKLKDAKETVKKLSEIKEKSSQAAKAITPEAQALIDSGAVSQWKKQPTYYFVKDLRKVALELDAETGNFKVSSNPKYAPKTESDQAKIQELLGASEKESLQDKASEVTPTQASEAAQSHLTTLDRSEQLKEFTDQITSNQPTLRQAQDALLELRQADQMTAKEFESIMTDLHRHYETLKATTNNEVKLEPNQDIIDAARAKDVKALSAHLKEGIKQYLNSAQYKQFLNAMSKFHRYSPGNIQLILAQKPDAKLIAPAGRWKSEFERFPAKGSKAIYIWDYREKLSRDEQGKQILDENGKPKKEHYFVLAPKFDVSQTVGKEMPKAVNELEDGQELNQVQVANLYRALKMTSLENGVPVLFEDITNGANGYYDPAKHSITLSHGMSQTQTLKTLIHEMAHSDLHNNTQREKVAYTYSNQELQAESVAYVVANHYGIDTSSYSFGYLASWSDDKAGLSDLEAQLKIVQQEAKSLITRIDTSMEKLIAVQNKQVPKNPFEEKLAQEKERTKQAQTVAQDQTIKKDQGVHL